MGEAKRKRSIQDYAEIRSEGKGDHCLFSIKVPVSVPVEAADRLQKLFDKKAREFLAELAKESFWSKP